MRLIECTEGFKKNNFFLDLDDVNLHFVHDNDRRWSGCDYTDKHRRVYKVISNNIYKLCEYGYKTKRGLVGFMDCFAIVSKDWDDDIMEHKNCKSIKG